MSVVGLDIGNLTCFKAVAAGGGIDTLANEYSDRCTPSYVSLNERNRCMGTSAKQQATTNVKNTISCFKRLIGRQYQDPQVQDEIKNFPKPYTIVEGKSGEAMIQAQYMGETQTFLPEQVMGMLITKLKETAEAGMKTKVVDVVISVPCYYTDIERRAMLAASQTAGLNCLKLMNDTTAVSLAYGIYKQDLPAENEKPRNVIFVDIGYCSLQVAAVSFNKGKLKVLAVASDPRLGGRDFDKVLIDHFIEAWKTKYRLEIRSRPKAYIRLAQECEKLKKLMSANSQKIPIDIECLMDDKDVSDHMERSEFESMCDGLLAKAEMVFKRILQATKFSPADIYAVEVVGGSSRIPCFKDLVTKVFEKEPSTTLNADEAIAKGCALQCAILSPTFRVRDFSIADCQPYPITLSWQGGGLEEDSSLEVFPEFHQIPFSKMLTFYRKENFGLEAKYSTPNMVPIKDPFIGSFTISNVQPQANGESSKVKVKVRVNNHGIFNVQSASMVEKLDDKTEEQGPESMETEGKENVENETQEMAQTNEEQQNDAPMETDQSQSNTEQANTEQPKDEEMKEEEKETEKKANDEKKTPNEKKEKKKKATVRSIDLPVEAKIKSYTKEDINKMVELEGQMIAQDKMEKERCDAKNAVEEYVYDMRDKLCGPLEEFTKELDRENFNKLLGETEDWLYDEGEDQHKQVYLDKLAELRKQGDPITMRYRESFTRVEAFNVLGSSLQLVRKFLDLYEAKDEKYDHLDKAEVDKVKKCLKEKSEWFEKQMNTQNKLKKYENPAVLTTQIQQTKQALENLCDPIINKPKPKPKEEPPKDEKKDEKKTEGKTEETNAAGDGKKEESAEQTPQADGGDMDLD